MRAQLFKFPAKAYLLALTATTGVTAFSFHLASPSKSSSLASTALLDFIEVAANSVVRSFRAFYTITSSVVDYKYSLQGSALDSDDYHRKLSEVHLRSAKRILKLCEANKGFYVKAGQFAVAVRQVPKEYSSTLASLQDQAVPCHFNAIKEVLARNLGPNWSDIFLSFEEQPIAAASIAQVHRAVLKDHQEVAVKVQYPGLEHQMKLDLATMSFLSKSVTWFFPEYRFGWLVTEFNKAIAAELDFIQEAKNSERTAKFFKQNMKVRVPHIFWEFTTVHVLTMQFCRGNKIDDLEYLRKLEIDPIKVAKALVEVFAEMIFVHGFVHGDPHPGNILVSPGRKNDFCLVLLDHGIYKELDETFRLRYCELWKALILLDSNKIQQLGERFGVGKYSRYFPVIFTGRTIDSKSTLGGGMPVEEKKKLRQELKSLKMEDISSFMESLPSDFLTVLRTDGLLRSLISKLGAPQRIRLLGYVKYALHGLSPKWDPEYEYFASDAYSRLMTSMNYIKFRLLIEALELLSCLKGVMSSLIKGLEGMLFSTGQVIRSLLLLLPT